MLLIVGDYDVKTKKLFQMPPVNAQSFLYYPFIASDCHSIKLTVNHRQKNDFKFRLFVNECRGLSNNEILNKIKSSKIFDGKYADYEYMLTNYNPDDSIILSSYRKGGKIVNANTDTINSILYKKLDKVNAKYSTTTKEHAKNESIQLMKENFDSKKYDLAYAITSHLCQGCEYSEDKTIYIMLTTYFEVNQLYVLLTRAKTSNQIKFVIPN
jgi:hypothetical protein